MINGLYKCFEHWAQTGTVWIYSDTHFGDKELEAGIPARPDVEEHIKRINAKVGKKDTLILLGDVGDIAAARRLKGYKVLIMGNHDSGRTNYEEVFDEVYEGALIIGEKFILSHEPIDVPWAFNFHGHDHAGHPRKNHLNCCADVVGYEPINLNQFMKTGPASKIETIHRDTINKATEKKKKRGGRSIAKTHKV